MSDVNIKQNKQNIEIKTADVSVEYTVFGIAKMNSDTIVWGKTTLAPQRERV